MQTLRSMLPRHLILQYGEMEQPAHSPDFIVGFCKKQGVQKMSSSHLGAKAALSHDSRGDPLENYMASNGFSFYQDGTSHRHYFPNLKNIISSSIQFCILQHGQNITQFSNYIFKKSSQVYASAYRSIGNGKMKQRTRKLNQKN